LRKRETDRRKYGTANCFPLEDNAGCIIPFNRSNKPDRRLRNLALREIDCDELNLYPADVLNGTR
jgi:hypothetical protein